MTEIVLPNDTNAQGNILGGRVMHLIDIAAAMSAMRHCRRSVNTVHVDKISFRHPIPLGHFVLLEGQVNYVGRTSMEVGVKVWSENPLTGERRHTSSAYLTFVALDGDRQPTPVPPLTLETDDDRRRFAEAEARRAANLRLRNPAE
jgi:acyl-CoA hydrolase